MKSITSLIAFALMCTLSLSASARDTKHMFSLKDALESDTFKERLDPNIKLYFGEQRHGAVKRSYGDFVSNKKTNAFNKSDIKACEWVLLSALLTLQERAVTEGGNAVVNIRSYYKKNTVSSTSEYECHAGGILAGVALIGNVVKLK